MAARVCGGHTHTATYTHHTMCVQVDMGREDMRKVGVHRRERRDSGTAGDDDEAKEETTLHLK